jgi:integrase/recombinase XerD
MTSIAPLMTQFLREYLPKDRGFSVNTCETYAHGFKIFFQFASKQLAKRPSEMSLEELTVGLVLDFLSDLENSRGNSVKTRNSRLASIKAFMKFVEFKVPSALEQSLQIQAIVTKRHDQPLIKHLTMQEVKTILDAPDITTRAGIRDRAMMHLCFAAGLRVSELVELPLERLNTSQSPNVHIIGKGRKERCLPLWKETAKDLRAWLSVRGDLSTTTVFANANGEAMTRAGFEYLLEKHVKVAADKKVSLKGDE